MSGRRTTRTAVLVLVTTLTLVTTACRSRPQAEEHGTPTSSAAPHGRYLGIPVDELHDVTVLDGLPFSPLELVASTHPDRLWVGSDAGLAWIDPGSGSARRWG